MTAERPDERRVSVRVSGVVQGVGYRPFIHARALELGLTGLVGNDAGGVFIEVQGTADDVEALIELAGQGPRMAHVEDVTVAESTPTDETGFRIVPSSSGPGTTSIPADTAVCPDCLDEMRDPDDRRYRYPFIACTNCGPRYTIVTGLPYDRPQTTMVDFPMCADCQREYDDPASRRFHAQPTACPVCGPRLDTTIDAIVAALAAGRIVAIKGIGGYHLACDAGNADAVSTLRTRKRRGDKPFALMARDIGTARGLVDLDSVAEVALTSPARPIVLAASVVPGLQESVAPGNSYLGVLLPYAPVHHLLFDGGAPSTLVMTSGNLADEPICTTAQEAVDRLSGLADVLVHHDRRIQVACDDSVLRAIGGGTQPVRRSRGYAPLPIRLPVATPDVLAVGGELKTTICVASGQHAWLSQHIGDTENLETLAVLARTASMLTSLQRLQPTAVVSDAHPAYLSRRWAGQEAARLGVAHLTVQHHHAHLASLLAEHCWPSAQPVLGFAFDGTGFGTDGTIWGGELLLGSYLAVRRVGHLAPIALPGGDAAIRRPLRTALAHAHAAGVPWDEDLACVRGAAPNEAVIIGRMLETGAGCTPSTSMGRLFDAISSILDVRHDVDYEGQAAIELEALAATALPQPDADAAAWAPEVLSTPDGLVLDPRSSIAAAVASVRSGRDSRSASLLFHEGLARAVTAAAVLIREETGVETVGLTGGVFANAVLTAACQGRLGHEGFTVLVHRRVPPNDGGLALGQVAVAAAGGAVQVGGSRRREA